MMTAELKKLITDTYTQWAGTWGMSLAFAVTQSVDRSEKIVADTIAALVATDRAISVDDFADAREKNAPAATAEVKTSTRLPATVNATRFAGVLFEMADRQAYRGFGTDPFFRMPAAGRAAVVLKAKAQMRNRQIAAILNINESQVDSHLENARLMYSDGKSWLVRHPGASTDSPETKTAESAQACPKTRVADRESVFARYLGNDIAEDEVNHWHDHFLDCSVCRQALQNFKLNYSEWVRALPSIETDSETRRHFRNISRLTFRMVERRGASPWPGVRKLLRDSQVWILFLTLSMVFVYQLLHRG